ncbi:MAG: class I SAM-dependent methyltransferase [Terracidiphilus sp.]
MPAPIYHVYPPDQYWSGMWANCDVDREVALCGKRELAQELLSVLRTLDDPLIVEAGCGVGAWVLYLQQQGFTNVVGVDNYVPVLRQLEARGGRAIEGDVQHLPFGDESVDICLSFGVVEHFPENPSACIDEMARVLVPGGYMFLTVPYLNWVRRLIAHPLRTTYIRLRRIPRRFSEYRFRDWEIIEFCRASGFEILRCSTDEYSPKQMSLGLYADFPPLRGKQSDELNTTGSVISQLLRTLNPWLASGGVLIVARKPKCGNAQQQIRPAFAAQEPT